MYDFIYAWFEKLVERKVYVSGYVIMPNHIHLLVYTTNTIDSINNIIGTGKRFMAYEIVKRLRRLNELELLKKMQESVSKKEMERSKKHQVFEPSMEIKEIYTEKFIRQKLNYMHKNPVSGKWKLVEHYLDYEYSSAKYYDLGVEGICRIYNYSDVISAESPQ
jgi:REP element-mobilizing transposase RayT